MTGPFYTSHPRKDPKDAAPETQELPKGCATLYDVVGSVKRHVECTSCGQLVFVLT